MKNIAFVLSLAIGYVLGARQGREGYERLKRRAAKLWNDPRTRSGVSDAEDAIARTSVAASEAVADLRAQIDSKATASTSAEGFSGNV